MTTPPAAPPAGPLAAGPGAGDPVLADFEQAVGDEGPVCVAGGRTQWEVGGRPATGTRELAAPAGVVSHEPAEMIVRVRAGTTVEALGEVLAAGGQMVPLDPLNPSRATVGGVLAVGRSGLRRLRYGPVRDTVLQVRLINSAGRLVTAGGPVVKNVTGFDLCRLAVGSLGTLGLLAEVVLRCYPQPASSRWFRSPPARRGTGVDHFDLLHRLYRPSSILCDGASAWVWLEGHPDDVAIQAAEVLGPDWTEVEGPPPPVAGAGAARLSLTAGQLRRLAQLGPGAGWLAQVGVGSVDTDQPEEVAAAAGASWPPSLQPRVADLHRALKQRFDPSGRLNPGRRLA